MARTIGSGQKNDYHHVYEYMLESLETLFLPDFDHSLPKSII